MLAQATNVGFTQEAWKLATRIQQETPRLMELSREHASRSGRKVVIPDDVKAALLDFLADISSAFENMCKGKLSEVEYTDAEFEKLAKLPFRVPEVICEEDDAL